MLRLDPIRRITPSRAAALALASALLAATAAQAAASETRNGAVMDDAQRFAAVFKAAAGSPSAEVLQSDYLAPGTPGIAIFTEYRIKNAANLASHVATLRPDYQHAIDLCLPEAQRMHDEVSATIAKVGTLLGSAESAPAYFLFGAGNSGGTASADGLGIGLEVICKEARTPAQAQQIIREFIAHEMTHVFQVRNGLEMHDHDLLQHTLSEGFADFIMGRLLGADTSVDATRRAYGVAHEAALWRRFQDDVAADKGDADWLFNGGHQPAGEPPDMGYWLGRRICESYYAHAADKAQAIRTLLLLKDPKAILKDSGYDGTSVASARQAARSQSELE